MHVNDLRQVARAFTSLSLITALAFTIPLSGLAQPDESKRPPQPAETPEADRTISNQDVLDMQFSGFSEAVILARIKGSQTSFDISVGALQELKDAGVPDGVLLAIIAATTRPKTAQPVPDSPMEATPDSTEPVVLLDGTPVKLRLNRTLSSADALTGDNVDFTVVEDVSVNGVLVIKQGAVALATVTLAQKKRRMGRAGKLNVNIDYVRLANGERANLRAIKEVEGKGKTGPMTGAIVASSILFFPAAPFFLFMRGKDITIDEGTVITAYVNQDVTLNVKTFKRSQ